LGDDLTRISAFRRWLSVILPFAWFAGYFALAALGLWAPAVLCLAALSFVTYGSVSHDLVHRTLGLPRRLNDFLLVAIELLALRSGTAYRLAHLHHHRRYPAEDDVEGAAARKSMVGALLEGVRFQLKLFAWAWANHPQQRGRLALEGGLILAGYLTGVAALYWTVAPLAYATLMTAGAWLIPLITSYLPHNPDGKDEVRQTRAFRGGVLSVLALEHLYHLEHHLYPAVPHHNWPELARRLEPYFRASGVRPLRLWF
jgi:beta-carotene hydroxylase